MLMPVLFRLAEEYQGGFILAKLNTEEQQELAAQFGIRSIPTVKLFKGGEPVDEFSGALPEAEIRAFLDRFIARESDTLVAQSNQLLLEGDVEGAMKLVEEAARSDPQNPRTLIAYARLKAAVGDREEAEAVLDSLPPDVQESPELMGFRTQLRFDRIAEGGPAPEQLEQRIDADPADSEARYYLAINLIVDGEYEQALEHLLQLMLKDRAYGDDAGRKGMLEVFEILGSENPLVNRFRNRMFNALH
jgi:putative thioredoxin